MTTVEFFARFKAGLPGDSRDFLKWAGALTTIVILFSPGKTKLPDVRRPMRNVSQMKKEYRYQFVRRGAAVFRYDNAPHHSQLTTFPHHKHVGTRILSAAEPAFRRVLDEAIALVTETNQFESIGDAGKKTGKKRRQASRKS